MQAVYEKTPGVPVKIEEVDAIDKPCQVNDQCTERMDGAFLSIICSAAIPCGLIVMAAAALVAVVIATSIDKDEGYPELRYAATVASPNASSTFTTKIYNFKKTGGEAAFFIDFNPSSLTAIATLTGKVIPYLSSSIMALVAFFAARRIIISSKDTNNENLLSPHQLSILIELLGGNTYVPLKNCVKHHVKTKQRWISPITYAFAALAVVTCLGIVIPLVDTWLSITVTPSTVSTVKKSNQTSSFGRALDCSNLTYSLAGIDSKLPCNLDTSGIGNKTTFFLSGANEAMKMFNEESETNTIRRYQDLKTGKIYYFLIDKLFSSDPYSRDFRTETLAVETQCAPMTRSCLSPDVDGYDGWVPTYHFDCGNGFDGSLLSNGATSAAGYQFETQTGGAMAGIRFSPHAHLSSGVNDADFASFQNPLYFGTWSVGWQVPPSSDSNGNPYSGAWDNDPQIFYDTAWNYIWMLNCSSTLYDVSYSLVDNTIIEWNTSVASQDTGGVLSMPFVSGLPAASICLELASAAITVVANSTEIAYSWSEWFSYFATALTAGNMVPQQNTIEQTRNNTRSATRVPMIPLFLLLGLKGLYCLAVLVLALAAWHYTNPRETQSVKERLTVTGLAAAYFAEGASHQQMAVKHVEQLFQPSTPDKAKGDAETAPADPGGDKVAIKPTDQGGWQFFKLAAGTVWAQVEPIMASEAIAEANVGAFGSSGKEAAELVSLLRK